MIPPHWHQQSTAGPGESPPSPAFSAELCPEKRENKVTAISSYWM